MPYNDDQIFYAALWWSSVLDGAEAWTVDIFKAYGKKPIALTPVKKPNDDRIDDETPVTQEQFRAYFDALYEYLKDGKAQAEKTSAKGETYIELGQEAGVSSDSPTYPDFAYSSGIEEAIKAAGIDRYAHMKGTHVWLHSDGQLYVTNGAPGGPVVVPLDYPGRPAPEFPLYPYFREQDMTNTYDTTWETFFRVVPLQEGQKYTRGYVAQDGTRQTREDTARKDRVLTLGQYESSVPLKDLTDEEILAFGPRITHSMADDAKEYVPGFEDKPHNARVEATDDPRIVRHLKGPVKVMDVTQKMAIGFASGFTIAEPGDKIIVEQAGYSPRVMKKASLENGNVRLIPYSPSSWQKTPAAPDVKNAL